MNSPRATVRLQFHRGFTLTDAREWVPYFARMGISHIYASPLTRARPGSTHGYDVVDHGQVNSELGGEDALRSLVARLREFGMGLIIDIVPNHMATSPNNPWWASVLQRGRESPHADWFDINWEPADPTLRGKVLAPFLGQPYGAALDSGDIVLRYDTQMQDFYIEASGARYPVAKGSLGEKGQGGESALPAFDPALPDGRARLHALLERQHYRLAWWRSAPEEINWRRFFEISELIGVCVEKPQVFQAVHAMYLRFYQEGLIDGLRVDHVDGLADPIGYCAQLQAALQERSPHRPGDLANDRPYLVIEKILAADESLDERWQVDGTTGYDFMDQVSAVLHDPAGMAPLAELWEDIARDGRPFQAIAQEARDLMLLRHFPAERFAAARALHRVARMDPATRDWGEAPILRVLWELLAVFPVYRTYAGDEGRHQLDAVRFDAAAAHAHARIAADRDGDDAPLLKLMAGWLGGQAPRDFPPLQRAARLEAIRRFQQLTPPLTAKSLEDTAFYRYGRLLSRSEVGSDPGMFYIAPDVFHRRCGARARQLPRAMTATATHDHKRGEDTRARLAVLSQIPGLWAQAVRGWMSRHAPIAYTGTGAMAHHPADLYMLLQCLVGAWPLQLQPDDEAGLQAFGDRVSAWQTKALREAKLRTSWVVPDQVYEQACEETLRNLLQPSTDPASAACELAAFASRISAAGAVNSLAQTVLRLTTPGVPDLYQGTEFWDFSLVDPDNRSPVDYSARAAALDQPTATDPEALLADWRSGKLKQAIVRGALLTRMSHPDVFEHGSYVPLPVLGPRVDHVLAFVRCVHERCVFTLVPRSCAAWLRADDGDSASGSALSLPRIDPAFWGVTAVVLPHRYAGAILRDTLSGRERRVGADSILPLSEALSDYPVSVLVQD